MKQFFKEMFSEPLVKIMCGYIIFTIIYTAILAGLFWWFVN